MTVFTVTIDDPASLDGITWARGEYNKSLPPPPVAEEGVEPPPNPTPPIETDQDYVQWVMSQAAFSYADQKLRQEYQQHYENAVAGQQQARMPPPPPEIPPAA